MGVHSNGILCFSWIILLSFLSEYSTVLGYLFSSNISCYWLFIYSLISLAYTPMSSYSLYSFDHSLKFLIYDDCTIFFAFYTPSSLSILMWGDFDGKFRQLLIVLLYIYLKSLNLELVFPISIYVSWNIRAPYLKCGYTYVSHKYVLFHSSSPFLFVKYSRLDPFLILSLIFYRWLFKVRFLSIVIPRYVYSFL